MVSVSKAAWLPLCVLAGLHVVSASARAQAAPASVTASAAVAADPTDPTAAVPAARYRSPYTGYRSFAEPAVAPWRDTNERVRQRGGWRAYAREASAQPAASPASAPAPAQTPLPSPGHSGHRMQ